MKLTLERDVYNKDWTQGKLYVDGSFLCYALEDTDRFLESSPSGCGKKEYGATAIPRGEYKITLTLSSRFGKVLPLLANVKCFTGVRIHAGNTAEDTEGCILVGMDRTQDGVVTQSRIALASLMKLLTNTKEEIVLEVA